MSAPARKPAIAYVVHSLNPGGTEKLVVEMALFLAERLNIVVFCLDEPGAWAVNLREHGIPVHCLWRQPGLDLSVSFRMARLFKKWNICLVHAHQYTPWFYSALSRVIFPKTRLLFEEHGRFLPEVDKRLRRFVNRLLITRLTHRLVAVSKETRDRLVRYEGLNPKNIEIVYNGVKAPSRITGEKRLSLRRGFSFGEPDFVVGTVGRLDPIKNIPMLLRSVGAARGRIPGLRCLIVGGGEEYPALEAAVVEQGLSDCVKLTGFRNDAPDLTQCMDLFVLSSLSEGTSIALVEAMAAGVPVAVTAVGGNPEVVIDGMSGWLVPSGDAARLSEVIEEAMRSPEKAKALATGGQRRFSEMFSFERMIGRYMEIYREMNEPGFNG
jgi:glycosyltransferase involved in cell wall biosynthesis